MDAHNTLAETATNPDWREQQRHDDLMHLTVGIVTTLITANRVALAELPDAIRDTFNALKGLGEVNVPEQPAPEQAKRVPAVSVKKSLASPDHIISMIDGKPYKTLKRHITGHGFTAESYRSEFGLPDSYPMVAPTYAATRRDLALKIGLGKK